MLRQVWICECDICGHQERAKAVIGRYNDTGYTIPDGWQKGHNKETILCPECASKVAGKDTQS